jgi:hypothetical protein
LGFLGIRRSLFIGIRDLEGAVYDIQRPFTRKGLSLCVRQLN